MLANNPIDKDSPSPCNKVMLEAAHWTYHVFTDKAKAELGRIGAKQKITSTMHSLLYQDWGGKNKDQ